RDAGALVLELTERLDDRVDRRARPDATERRERATTDVRSAGLLGWLCRERRDRRDRVPRLQSTERRERLDPDFERLIAERDLQRGRRLGIAELAERAHDRLSDLARLVLHLGHE